MGSNARTMFMELCKRLQTSLRDYDDAATKSQDWRPGLFSGRPYGTLCRAPSHSAEIPGLASWAIFRASLRDFVPSTVTFGRNPRTSVLGYFQGVPTGLYADCRLIRTRHKCTNSRVREAGDKDVAQGGQRKPWVRKPPNTRPGRVGQRLQALPPRFGAMQGDAPRPGIPCGHAGPHSGRPLRGLVRHEMVAIRRRTRYSQPKIGS